MNPSEYRIEVSFGREGVTSQPLDLSWKVIDSEVTPFWLKFLTMALKNKIFFKPRFMGFIDGPRDPQYLTDKLNECIEVINKDGRHCINKRLEGEFTQDFSNYIHHEFEILIGDEWKKTDYWEKSSFEVRSAVVGLNDYAHELEAWQRSSEGRKKDSLFTMAYVLTEFFEAPSMDIKDTFDDAFTMDTDFGDMTLHYTQIGKTWLEVCLDKDEDIFDPAIQPLWKLSGSFNIMFHDVNSGELKKEVYSHLKKLGKDPMDKQLRLGLVPVAKLDLGSRKKEEVVKLLSERQDINRVSIFKNNELVAENKFPPKHERYFYDGKDIPSA